METNQLLLMAQAEFDTPQGSQVDVLYGTSDGKMNPDPSDAREHASTLEDKRVVPIYKYPTIRRLGEVNLELGAVLDTIDYLKLEKLRSSPFVYSRYMEYSKQYGRNTIDEALFLFIGSKIYTSRRPTYAGQKDKIYMFKHGIVDGVFLRRYSMGQVFQVGDNLVFTTHTNTELMNGTYQHIFGALFQ